MSKKELPKSPSQLDQEGAAHDTVPGNALYWWRECIHDIEVEYTKRTKKLSEDADESDFRKCLLSSTHSVLHKQGLSRAEVAEVLSDPEAFPYGLSTHESVRDTEGVIGSIVAEGGATDEIDRLYDELAKLNLQRDKAPGDSNLQNRIRQCFGRLRQLQEEEAAAMEAHFSRTLSLPIGKAGQVLREAEELVRRYANTSRADETSDQADD